MFYTIQPGRGLSPADRRRAHRLGPPVVAVRTSYRSLLGSAGFVEIEASDETEEYRAAQVRWIAADDRYESAIRAEMGDEAYDERRRNRIAALQAIDDGLLVRYRYSATR